MSSVPTKGEIRVRRADTGDVVAMTDIAFRSKQSNGYSDAFMEACRDELRVTEESLEVAMYWVAEREAICGLVALTQAGEVHAFFIDPDLKRQGIGRKLWSVVLAQAEASGMTALRLDADPEAVPFYESLGFLVIGTTPSGSIPGRELPLMALEITQG